jgi:hypothetical protein
MQPSSLTLPDRRREFLAGEHWDRAAVKEALDLLESVYRLNRKNIRFRHK